MSKQMSSWKIWSWFMRLDSLFTRLLVVQFILVLGVFAIYSKLFYTDRNHSMAELAAAHWAGALRQPGDAAAAWDRPTALPGPPPPHMRDVTDQSRFAALRPAFARRGVQVGEMGVSDRTGEPVVWLQVRHEGAAPQWFGVTGLISVPNWPVRQGVAWIGANVLLLIGAWLFTRWLTRPMERLRSSMKQAESGLSTHEPLPPDWLAMPEIRQLQASFQQLLHRLHQQERERELLLAGVSHDLRSPLTRIRLAADLLPDEPHVARFKDSVVRNVQVADKLVASLIDFVWSAQVPLAERVDVTEAIGVAVDQFALDESTVQLQWADAVQPVVLQQGQTELVERLLTNLIDNALKHGQVPVTVRVSRDASAILLDVLDHGAGLSVDAVANLSQAFARGESSRQIPGFGLGLAIVHQVAHRLGGQVEMAHEGAQWRVRVRLPSGS